MKKTHIILLIGIAALIVGMVSFATDFSTYESIESARNKKGKAVHIIAKYDPAKPLVYDPINNPNYLSFYVTDSLGGTSKVIYRNSKPTDLERSERVVMKGKMTDSTFECKEILLKCPSKYKEDKEKLQEGFRNETADGVY